MKKIMIALAVLLAYALPVLAEKDTRTPIEAYQGAVGFAMITCPLSLEIATLGGNPEHSDWMACINTAKKNSKVRYEAAVKTLKKPAARAALKEHYIAAIAAITSIAPESGEIRMNYNRRQAENKGKLTERWARFEVEN